MIEKHDKHYRNLGPYEPTKIIEHFIKTTKLSPVVAYHLGHVLRYILRAGNKEGQPWETELEKAANYLNRALKGVWIEESMGKSELEKAAKEIASRF